MNQAPEKEDFERKRNKKKLRTDNQPESISSLLNFKYEDNREPYERYKPAKQKMLSANEKQKLKKNYLQGNFKFLVNPDFIYDTRFLDPDQEIPWETIEKVKYTTNNKIACPICLNQSADMIVPKITKCGHMFCLPCILKYLSYQKPKCPLCEDYIISDQLKNVSIMYFEPIEQGQIVTLKLKKRPKKGNCVYNADDLKEEEEFIRIKKIYFDEINDIKEKEKTDLFKLLAELEKDKDSEYKDIVIQALTNIKQEIENIQPKIAAWKIPKWKEKKDNTHEFNDFDEERNYFFYQEINGLNIFLHNIENKYLRLDYGHSQNYPHIIEQKLLEFESFQQTDKTRKRFKFTNHIPLNSDIKFARVEMKDILSPENYEEMNRQNPLKPPEEEVPQPSLSKLLKATKSNQVDSDFFQPTTVPYDPSDLKLENKFDYPELSSNYSSEEKGVWSELMGTVPKIEKSKSSMPKLQSSKKKDEEFKKTEDYIVDESNSNDGYFLSDLLSFATVKKSKSKRKW